MCRRVLLTGKCGEVLATYQGQAYSKVSFDSRCAINTGFDANLQQMVTSFRDSDKPGVMILNPAESVKGAEFTDSVPDEALIIEFTGTEAPAE